MSKSIPQEVFEIYGVVAVSRIARNKTQQRLSKLPKVQALLKKPKGSSKKAQKTLSNLDVENGGMSDEFTEVMREGFLCLIPDDDCPDPRWPGPDFTPLDLTCAQIAFAAEDLEDEYAALSQALRKLPSLVEALERIGHPFIAFLVAMIKSELVRADERLAEISAQYATLVEDAADNGCSYPVYTF